MRDDLEHAQDGGPAASDSALPGKRDIFYESTDGLRLYAADYGPEDAALTARTQPQVRVSPSTQA